MGNFDLYGNSYKSRQEALNAETAQMAEIDARNNYQKIDTTAQNLAYEIGMLREYCKHLEERIKKLEGKLL